MLPEKKTEYAYAYSVEGKSEIGWYGGIFRQRTEHGKIQFFSGGPEGTLTAAKGAQCSGSMGTPPWG